jgi:hypothetical protein
MASESIGNLYPTEIPGYVDSADIQAAFRLYHYGSLEYDIENTDIEELVNPSIAYTLNDLQTQITGLDPAGSISKSIVDAKGDLIVGTASDSVSRLPLGSNNFVLTADSSQTLGVKWSALTLASTSSPGVVQLNDGYSSTSITQAPTANALKTVFDLKANHSLSINEQTGTSYTLVANDALTKIVKFTNSSAVTVTVPPATFTVGQQINIAQYGAGKVTLVGGSGITVSANPSLSLRAQYSVGTLLCIDSNNFIFFGDNGYQ